MEKKDVEFYAMSQREVAEALGISRIRVQQLERKAMAKLRRLVKQRDLRWQDLTTEDE